MLQIVTSFLDKGKLNDDPEFRSFRLTEFSNGLEGFHIYNVDGFAVDLQDAILSKLAERTDHIFGGHTHEVGHFLSGQGEVKFK